MNRRLAKLACFARFAKDLGTLSTCRRASVGCVIVTPTLTEVLSIGYNGQRRGAPNDGCSGETGRCGCVHAEANALIRLSDLRDALMISTTAPCETCASLIVNRVTIREVMWLLPYRDDLGLRALRDAGVTVTQLAPGIVEAR